MSPKWAIQVAGNYSWFESLVDRHNGVDLGFMVDTYDAQGHKPSKMEIGEARKLIMTAAGRFLDERAKQLKVAEVYAAKLMQRG